MLKLLSGNEALALGVYHAGVMVASAYPGTPSTEILESLSRHKDVHAEWSSDERVAMEVALGASFAGVRAMVSMKHVGLNVASDPFMSSSVTGVNAGLVMIVADDPGMHSSQSEQDTRNYAKFAKVPLLEPGDSQEAYDFIEYAFDISEKFDTPVIVRSTTRLSHAKSVVDVSKTRAEKEGEFGYDISKYVLLPVYARGRRPAVEQRVNKLRKYAETLPLNKITWGDTRIGIVSSGVVYQYAREAFPSASFLKLGMVYPLPQTLIKQFASHVEKLIVIEELDPFIEDNIRLKGISVIGKVIFPSIGEFSPDVIKESAVRANILAKTASRKEPAEGLPKRPPLLCPGCPHTGLFHVLSSIDKRSVPGKSAKLKERDLAICGDIGCYTLGTYPPLSAMDFNICMGASIGTALGMERSGIDKKVVAVIGDSTFYHSGISGLLTAVYFNSKITIVILDNLTTAMTGHQDHPGTGISVQGEPTTKVELEQLVRGCGVEDVVTVDAFDIKSIRKSVKSALDAPNLSVIIVRGNCAVRVKQRSGARVIDAERCNDCGKCLLLGCSAIQKRDGMVVIDAALCAGDICTICQQVCSRGAIHPG
ncbi:indolepyruvate ferredoxin oxidoreductase subunit alpha [Chloroflexota bacterium]